MTVEDVEKWCDRGGHNFVRKDILRTVGVEDFADFYVLEKCSLCPSMRVEKA